MEICEARSFTVQRKPIARMKRIIFTKKDLELLRSHLLRSSVEEAAIIICGISETQEHVDFLVREVIPVPNEAFLTKESAFLKVSPEFLAPIIKRCRLQGLSVILAHSHPFSGNSVTFSFIDDFGEKELIPKIRARIPNRYHGAIVLGRSSIDAKIWEKNGDQSSTIDLIKIIGEIIEWVYPTSANVQNKIKFEEIFDRQVLAFGEAGQRKVQQVTVGIVGLGGIGSQVFQQLVHLGVQKIICIDNDVVEKSNLSRLVGATLEDVEKKRSKVEVMGRLGKQINPSLNFVGINDSVNNFSAAIKLRDADIIFCCTDTLASRMVLNQIAYQYLIPMIDTGVEIQSKGKGKIRSAGGRVMVILPDGPCLGCLGILNPAAISQEKEQASEQRTGYITGEKMSAPSVISLNGVIASLAVTEFLNLLTGFEGQKGIMTYQSYRILKGIVQRIEMKPLSDCTLCTEVKALGDNIRLPCRLDK